MSVEAIDHALRLRRDERDRISGDLLDLESHQGHLLLKGAKLRGESLRRWDAARALMVTMWWLFDAYQRALTRAEEIRARAPRPGQADMAELSKVLTGPSVELRVEDVPVEQRSLLRQAGEWLTLDQLVARMDTAYRDVADVVAAADGAWTVLAAPLNGAEASLRAAEEARRALGDDDAELARLTAELTRIRDDVRADPLFFAASGSAPFDRLRAQIEARREVLDQAVAVRAGFEARRERLRVRVAEVVAAEDAARQARDVVLTKIYAPVFPVLPHQALTLGDRLAALDALRSRGDWTTLARRAADLERAVTDAQAQAQAATRTINELLDRRDELRGRLQAFHAKAVRLGHAEHPELAELYRRARDLLWTAPCDLRQATVAVAGYQRAIKGAGG